MRRLFRLLVPAVVAVGLLVGTAGATHNADRHFNMEEVSTSPRPATWSDLAFWGKHAFIGYYTPDAVSQGGVRIFDISNPGAPVLLRDFACDANQNDPIVWDRNGNGVADLMLLAVDRTMTSPECGAPRTASTDHGNPLGWEGVRVFTMSDDRRNPFTNIQQVKAVYTDCGAHTITAMPMGSRSGNGDDDDDDDDEGDDDEGANVDRLLVYVSSYPLRPGPTCGDTEHTNTANPYDEDPGSPANPLHGVIQIVEVPFDNPAASHELDVQPEIHYPGDPDQMIDWCERSVTGPNQPCPGPLEPAAVACHDIVVHIEHNMAGAACAEQGQVWEIDENGIPDTEHPMAVMDDKVSSGGSGTIPGAVDFFHSVMFDNEGEVVNLVDESFGTGCPTMTTWRPRPWNPAGGVHKTGKMFFTDLEGNFLSEFHVGDLRPEPSPSYCSAHMGMAVMGIKRDLLVNAWYTGGVDVIDFTDATNLREIAFYDPARNTGTWSAYPYIGPRFKSGRRDVPVYASDGVTNNALAQGFVVYRAQLGVRPPRFDHLNPQTMD